MAVRATTRESDILSNEREGDRLRIYLIRGEKQFINVQRATQNRMSTELKRITDT